MSKTHNYEAEAAVLGSIFVDSTLFKNLYLEEKHFNSINHQRIFNAMKKVDSKEMPVNFVTVVTEMGEEISSIGGTGYLLNLTESIASTESFKYHERLILEAYKLRETQKLSLAYSQKPEEEHLDKFIENLQSLRESGSTQASKTKNDYLAEIANDMMSDDTERKFGFKTSFSDFDDMTGGLQKEDLIIVAARPSVGKTAFALNITEGHCSNGGIAHIYSLEMGAKSLLQRMISAKGNIDGIKWKSMAFNENDYDSAMNAIGEISNWDININDEVRTVGDIRLDIRKAVKDQPDKDHLVLIDYLQLLTPTGKHDRRDLEVGAMTRDFKLLAKELKIPIILLSQLSRGVEQRQDKRPMMSDLRESGNIEQDADVIAFLYRDDYYNKESEKQNIIEIIISKQRNGPTGTVELAFIKEYGKFVDLDYRYSRAR